MIGPSLADYELVDCGDFMKLERFGDRVVARPEPQAVWRKSLSDQEWARLADATFARAGGSRSGSGSGSGSGDERGQWMMKPGVSDRWTMRYDYGGVGRVDGAGGGMHIRMRLALTGFKHVGVFPEQAANWNFIYDTVREMRRAARSSKTQLSETQLSGTQQQEVQQSKTQPSEVLQSCEKFQSAGEKESDAKIKVLNLFAYTGGATLAARSAGAEVTHVDSVKQTVAWARDCMELSGLDGVRWIVDDALKFVGREVRRGSLYDGIILDPPAYGRGPDGEKWVLERELDTMLSLCSQLLKPHGFLVLNLYSMGLSALLARTAVRRHFAPTGADALAAFVYEQAGELYFTDRAGKDLPLGVYYRLVR